MSNPRNRPKHLQSRCWFRVEVENSIRIVRPVDGEEWFDAQGIDHGVVYMVDEDAELVAIRETGWFDKNAVKIN